MQKVINLALLLAMLLLNVDSIAYGNPVSCKSNLVPLTKSARLAKAASENASFIGQLTQGGVVMTERTLSNTPAVTVSARINVAAADVGKVAEVINVAKYKGAFYMKTVGGWQPWDLQLNSLEAVGTPRKLAVTEDFDVEANLTLQGDFEVYVGYCVAQGDMQYSKAPPLTFTLKTASKPDLTVNMLGLTPKTVVSSGRAILVVAVKNIGEGVADPTVLTYYQSSDATISAADTKVCPANVPGLAANAQSQIGCQVTTPTTPGTYYYGACVESVDNEANTANNCTTGEVLTVAAPPAICTSPQVLANDVCVTPTATPTPTAVATLTPTPTVVATVTPTPQPTAIVTPTPTPTPTVKPNTLPVANASSLTALQDTAKAITLGGSDADGDALTYKIASNPAHGTVSITGSNAIYTPAGGYNGADSFTFKVNDGKGDSAAALVTITVQAAAVSSQKLNDTGIDANSCYSDGSDKLIGCSLELAKNLNAYQDGMTGRDVSSNNDSDGHAGFSFTKICNSGQSAGTGSCPSSPSLGAGANDWGCTKDNVTGLTWEIKTDGGLHDKSLQYYNYTSTYNIDSCNGIPCYRAPEDASGFVNAVNVSGFCGSKNWRLPEVDELLSLVDYSVVSSAPLIDTLYFPNTFRVSYWTGTKSFKAIGGAESTDNAWQVSFASGGANVVQRGTRQPGTGYVRLVKD